jgi:GrpB-like predicted nucleotidyltransferase (UPF0157 family)
MQRVVVVPHDPSWAAEFAGESRQVELALGDVLVAIHHIGSTAIPGIHSKPIIDMLAVVSDLATLDGRDARLQALGYEAKGEFGIPGRRYYRKDDSDGRRTHHLHAFQVGSPQVERHLAFRDFLTAHPEWAEKYGALKRRLAEAHPTHREAYMDGKDEFIREVGVRAAAWRARGGIA